VASTHSRTTILGFLAAVLALMLFVWIAVTVLRGQGAAFDGAVRNAVHAWASPRLTWVMRGVSQLGEAPFLIGAGLLVVWRLAASGRKRAAVLLAGTVLGSEALTQILKLVFHRPRPEAFFGLPNPEMYSFPSGHAITSCCFWGVLAAILAARSRSLWVKAGLWTLASVLAALVGFSRVYLGVHYPTDVLAGYALAVVWVAVVRARYAVWLRR
jgi:undecaprenyl-diphosphatase